MNPKIRLMMNHWSIVYIVVTIVYILLNWTISDTAFVNKVSPWLMQGAIAYQLFCALRDEEPKRSQTRLLRFFIPYMFIVVYSVVIYFMSDDETVETITMVVPTAFMCYELYLMKYDNK